MQDPYIIDYAFSQSELEQYYKATKPTMLSSAASWLASIFCTHKKHTLVKYQLRRSIRERDKNTSREYQYVRLPLDKHHWKCAFCGKRSELAQPVVAEPDDSLYDVRML